MPLLLKRPCVLLLLAVFFNFLPTHGQCPSVVSSSCDGSGTSLNLYWVGTDGDNNGDWNTPCSWRVGNISGVEPCQSPRSIDNVFFDATGFNDTGSPKITINSHSRCNDLTIHSTINSLSVTPEFELSLPGFLEVYGSFTLENNITWTIVGGNATGPEILFKSTNTGNTITTAGHAMSAIQFDGIGGGWSLADPLNAGSINFVYGYFSTSDGTNSHDMQILTFDSDVKSGAVAADRQIDLNNSTITVSGSAANDRYPYNTTNAPACIWECRGTSSTHLNFNASSSEIIFTNASPFVRLGGINYNRITHTGTGRFYDHFGPDLCSIDTLTTSGYLYFHHKHTFNVLEILSVSKQHDFFQDQTITGDLIISGNACEPTILKSEYNRLLTMPSSVTADPMTGFLINNLRCADGSGGDHIVNGSELGTTTGWNVLPLVSRDLYWVGDTDNNWTVPTNWSTSSTGTPLLASTDCPPTQGDNVFFISPLADGDSISINDQSYCNNQTWNITSPVELAGANVLNIYGNLQFDTDMTLSTSAVWNFFGTAGNTIFSAGKSFPSTIYIQQFSDYTLLDDINFNRLYLFRQDNFTSAGFDLDGRVLLLRAGTQNLSGSIITLSSEIPWRSNGDQGTTTYNASSHVIFTNTSAKITVYGWGANLKFPNFTLQSALTTLKFRDHFGVNGSDVNNIVFEGDVTLNGSMRYYADEGTGVSPSNLKQLAIGGDLNLAPDQTYEFGVQDPITIGGDLNSIGNCSAAITIKGIDGNTFDINISGTTNIDYTLISDMHSGTVVNATNSLDAGNNVNVNVVTASSLTYYWRALSGSCPGCDYSGDWNSTAGYWTTNSLSTEGTIGCIPGPEDIVIFDNMSFSGSTSSITIPASVACHDIRVVNSDIELLGTGNLKITGGVGSDGTLDGSLFTGSIAFVSNDGAGENIDFGGATLGCDLNFANTLGTWTLSNNTLTTTKGIFLNSGNLNTNNLTVNMNTFNSANSAIRSLDLSGSIININGGGNFATIGSPTNNYTWNTSDNSNFTFTAATSTINFTSSAETTILSSPLNLNVVNFTSTSSTISTSPVLLVDGWNTKNMTFDCSARIYGDNAYDTLKFTPGNVYRLESGSVQTINAPDGILIADGTSGNEIAIKSITTGTPATFHKENTGGSNSTFCFDFLSVEDNLASSDDPTFVFFTGINSNNISASGIWDFTRPIYSMPDIDSDADQIICPGSYGNLTWNLNGSGPYDITYTANDASPTTITIPNGVGTYSVPVYPAVDKEYKVTALSSNDCIYDVTGTIIDSTQMVTLALPANISTHNDSANCALNNEANFVHFHENMMASERPILSLSDDLGGAGMGTVTATVRLDGTVQYLSGVPYLQRHYGIEPTNNESGVVRLYFSQSELDALSTAWGTPLTPGDLSVTKFANNTLDFTGTSTLLPIVSSGSIATGITTSSDILYVEINTPSFSHFLIHPGSSTPLPIELLAFSAIQHETSVTLNWQTKVESDCDYFTIQRSSDGITWEPIGIKKGAGNSTQTINYEINDRSPLPGTSYYRLIQYDFGGDYATYGPITVVFTSPLLISIYPNPTQSFTQLSIHSQQKRSLNYTITDIRGRLLKRTSIAVKKGENLFYIDARTLSTGIYYITLFNKENESIQQIKLVVQ